MTEFELDTCREIVRWLAEDMDRIRSRLPGDQDEITEEARRLESVLNFAARPLSKGSHESSSVNWLGVGLRNTIAEFSKAVERFDSAVQDIRIPGRSGQQVEDLKFAKHRSQMALEWTQKLLERMEEQLEEDG